MREKITPILERLSDSIETPIEISHKNESIIEPIKKKDKLYIFVYGAPSPITIKSTKSKAWGFTLGKTCRICTNDTIGDEIKTPEGDILAELVNGNSLYIYNHFSNTSEGNVEIFSRVLHEAKILYNRYNAMSPNERKMRSFINIISKTEQKEINNLEHDIYVKEDKLSKLRKELISLDREVASKQTMFINMKNTSKSMSFYEDQWKSIFKNKLIRDIEISGSRVIVSTSLITCTEPKSKIKYEIGEFKIQLDLGSGKVKFFNMTRSVNGFDQYQQAPHVFHDGNPCLGNVKTTLTQLISKYDLITAIDVCIAFLSTCNVDDGAGRHVSDFPFVGETPESYKHRTKQDQGISPSAKKMR